MIICHCYRLTDTTIRKALYTASGDVSEALYECGLAEGCGGCTEAISELANDCGFSVNANNPRCWICGAPYSACDCSKTEII